MAYSIDCQMDFYLQNNEVKIEKMGININDLDGSLQPIGASLLSGNESILDNLRELSDQEQKISGGGKKGGGPTIVTGGGFGGGFVPVPVGVPVYGGFGGFGGFGGGNITFNVSSNSNSRANAS